MTVSLTRTPTREDFYAAKDLTEAECRCPDAAKVMMKESDKILCKPCKVRKRWNELLEAIDGE
jgi:hypothetical protein